MKLIKFALDECWESPTEEFNDLLIFPVENIECFIFSEFNIFRFSKLFPFFKPIGHNIAIVNISEKKSPELYKVVQTYPKFIYIRNGNMFMPFITKSALLTSSHNSEIVTETFPLLEQYTDREGNVNPLLIFISLIRGNFHEETILEKMAQIGFPYKKIFEKNIGKIVDDRIFELTLNPSERLIYSIFKKEVSILIKEYPSFFGMLSRVRAIKENIPTFIEKTLKDEESKYNLRESHIPTPTIGSLVFIIIHRDETILKNLVNILREQYREISFDVGQSITLKSELIEIKSQESTIFIEELGIQEVIPEGISYIIRVDAYGAISIDKFDEYKSNLAELFYNIFGNINNISKRKISLRLKGISLRIPEEYYKSAYATFQTFIHKYALLVKSAAIRRKVFSYIGADIQIDIEFPFGEKLVEKRSEKRSRKTLEDFEKPSETSENTPKVYKGWNGKRGKSKHSLEDAHILTKIAIRYILNEFYLKGKDLLHATKESIREDIEFLERGKPPSYISLRRYVSTYNDKIVEAYVNKNPPIIDCDMKQCKKYYKINNKYLNFTEESETLRSFESFLDIKKHLLETSNSKEFRNYLFIYKTILISMGIEDDSSEDLLFTLKFLTLGNRLP
ncbi:MAG: hypothetical protein KAW47_04845 [Thermoplasmatales archaeon]|nr:hypothetical protein [Thermoplasmatales archaeon]